MIKLVVVTIFIFSMLLPLPITESSSTYAEMGEQCYLEKDYETSVKCFDKASFVPFRVSILSLRHYHSLVC